MVILGDMFARGGLQERCPLLLRLAAEAKQYQGEEQEVHSGQLEAHERQLLELHGVKQEPDG